MFGRPCTAIHRPESAQEGRPDTMNAVAKTARRFCVGASVFTNLDLLFPAAGLSTGNRCLAVFKCQDSSACDRTHVRPQSQDKAPPLWYSMTRVSKKFRSFFKSIISLIHGNGFSSFGKSSSRPICVARRLAM
jgi:hypothetical protein